MMNLTLEMMIVLSIHVSMETVPFLVHVYHVAPMKSSVKSTNWNISSCLKKMFMLWQSEVLNNILMMKDSWPKVTSSNILGFRWDVQNVKEIFFTTCAITWIFTEAVNFAGKTGSKLLLKLFQSLILHWKNMSTSWKLFVHIVRINSVSHIWKRSMWNLNMEMPHLSVINVQLSFILSRPRSTMNWFIIQSFMRKRNVICVQKPSLQKCHF